MIIIITKVKISFRAVKTAALGAAVLFLFAVFLYMPSATVKSAGAALNVCASSIIPSLFPFAVLAGIINSSGILTRISAVIGKPLGYIFGVPAETAYVLLIGALCGFPIGTICVRDLYQSQKLSSTIAARLVAFSSNASPAFCISALGISFFGDRGIGVKLYICQFVSLLVIAALTRPKSIQGVPTAGVSTRNSISDIITASVADGGKAMIKVCSFAVFFAVVGDILCSAASKAFGAYAASVCAAVCELTLAGRYAALLNGKAAFVCAAFAVGWAGISVHMQTASVLSGTGISLSFYRTTKLLQGVISAIIMFAVT